MKHPFNLTTNKCADNHPLHPGNSIHAYFKKQTNIQIIFASTLQNAKILQNTLETALQRAKNTHHTLSTELQRPENHPQHLALWEHVAYIIPIF